MRDLIAEASTIAALAVFGLAITLWAEPISDFLHALLQGVS